MEKVTNLHSLLIRQTRMLLDAKKQQLDIFPKMAESIADQELKEALNLHYKEMMNQVRRLQEVLDILDSPRKPIASEAMKGFIFEINELIDTSADPEVQDAGLIAVLQQMKHYEIAGHGAACSYAKILGLSRITNILHGNLEIERKTDMYLTGLAEQRINVKAKSPVIA